MMKRIVFCWLLALLSLNGYEFQPPNRQASEGYRDLYEEFQNSGGINRLLQKMDDNDDGLSPRIIGGSPADKQRYPYFTLLLHLDVGNNVISYCGGSLIHRSVILTAAHCLVPGTRNIAVYVNRTESASFEFAQQRLATSFISHPDYTELPVGVTNDVMLLSLDQPVTVIQPVTLNRNPAVPLDGQTVNVCGFGRTDFANTPTELQDVALNVVAFDDCNDSNSWAGNIIDATMICANDIDQVRASPKNNHERKRGNGPSSWCFC